MQRFSGNHPISIDEKNRIVIPSRWRTLLGEEVTIQLSQKGCLSIYPQATYDALFEKINARAESDMLSRRELEYLSQYTEEYQAVDRSGRLLIPNDVKGYFAFEGELLLTGTIDKLELWRKEDHTRFYASERDFIMESRDKR